jgi:hypothetical protein
MLIDKGVTPGEVITIKLTSGEELVAKLVEEQAGHIKIVKSMVLTAGPNGLAMVPYLFTVEQDKEIQLSKNTITVIAPTMKPAADQYLSSTSNIKIVS